MAKFNTCHQLPSEMVNLATLDAHGLAYRLTEASRGIWPAGSLRWNRTALRA